MSNKIIVVGSSNTDMVLKTARFPKPGETILGGDFFVFQGGKGANQAVAAARLGGDIHFICRVGNDPFGQEAIKHYANEGMNVSGIVQDETAATGVAIITVNAEGENSIIVASGANALLSIKDVSEVIENIQGADWIITQLETPLDVVSFLSEYAQQNNKHLILNPAPAAALPDEVYNGLFLITPNETEAQLLTGIEVVNEATAKQAAEILKSKGVQNIIITLGSKGAYVYTDELTAVIETMKVTAVDSTAAGDVFNGSLVVALSTGKSWEEAVHFACKAAAISVTKMGAQASAPFINELDNF